MTKEEKIKVLERARDRWIAYPATKVLAADRIGDQVGASSPEAVCWCAMGAIIKEAEVVSGFRDGLELYFEANDVFQWLHGSEDSLVAANDSGRLTIGHWNEVIAGVAAK
jgi:hypothetical protein